MKSRRPRRSADNETVQLAWTIAVALGFAASVLLNLHHTGSLLPLKQQQAGTVAVTAVERIPAQAGASSTSQR